MDYKTGCLIRRVSIIEFQGDFVNIAAGIFSKEELKELEKSPFQTKAGFYAVKKALKDISLEIAPSDTIREDSFILSHKESGAPYVKSVSEYVCSVTGLNKNNFFISLSHNRINAYGMAAVWEKPA